LFVGVINEVKQTVTNIEQIVEVTKDEVASSDQIIKTIDSVATIAENLNESKEELEEQYLELKKSKESLLLSEEKYRILVENSQDAVYSCNIDGLFTAVNRKFCEVTGLTRESIIGKGIAMLNRSSEFIQHWSMLLRDIRENGKTKVFEYEFISTDGRNHIINCTLSPIFNLIGEVVGITGTDHDISEIRENERAIRHLAYYDSLTDLPNRVLFIDRLNNAIERTKRNQTNLAVIFLDFDNFKNINDTLGHLIGDKLIKEVSNKFKQIIRKHETVARFGGDEFAIIIDDITCKEDIIRFIKRLRSVFDDPFNINGNELFVGSSMGVSIYPNDSDNIYELMKNADTAMYEAKEVGKNTYRFYNQEMMKDIIRKLEIERCLRNALNNNELFLRYQPQIEAKTGRVRGCEALLRWESQELGMISPSEFIPIAEDTGLIMQIGEWVLTIACRNNKEWQDKYGFKKVIAVNISAIQLRHKNFIEIVKKVLNETGMRPEYLELEITESVLINSFDMVSMALEELKNMGVKIALDDFGTGYSSLNYLQKLPFNTLKIDKTFVQDIKVGSKEELISETIISFSHNLGLEVIAEGVETKEQLEFLQRAECDNFQGFLLCKPINENEIAMITRIEETWSTNITGSVKKFEI
ncbi:MAG: EAL domain-containing protein, partial [Bacillota bacterium]|nr:EAL domain-containing protein [Bacillota bacterium]